MSVRREQLSGHALVEYFLCPFCKNVAQDMVIHDGGYNQSFCQRPFCTSCLARYHRVTEKSLTGPLKKIKYSCPVSGCDRPLQAPMLRSPDACELILYKKISIMCDYCSQSFDPYEYSEHKKICNSKVKPSFILKDFGGPLADGRYAEKDGLYEKNLLILNDTSPGLTGIVHFGSRYGVPSYLDFRLFCARSMVKCRSMFNVNYLELLVAMQKRYGFIVDVDLVYIEYKRLDSCPSLKEFLEDIPVGAPILVSRIFDKLFELNSNNCFYYVQGVDKKTAGTDEPVIEIEEAIEED